MTREQLVAEAVAVGQAAEHNLRWMKKHPERYDAELKEDMEAYLNMLIRFAKDEMKNARLAGRTPLRTRLRNLVASIIAHTQLDRKGA